MPSETDDIRQAILIEDAVIAELQALTLLDQSRDLQDRCRRKVQSCAESICTLQDALPRQRPGG